MKLLLKTLTPVHIGNGETLKPLSYVIDRSFIYAINMEEFFKKLEAIQKKDVYLKWIEPILYQLFELDSKIAKARDNLELKKSINRQKRDLEGQLSLDLFIKEKCNKAPVEFVKNCVLYKIPFLSQSQREGFRLFIKNGNGNVYIPGTEIKGSIRSAILYSVLQDNNNYKILKSELEKFKTVLRGPQSPREKVSALKKISNTLEGSLLRGSENKANFDFLRFIQVSDTTHISSDKLRIETTKMMGTERYTKTWVETIIPSTEMEFELNIIKEINIYLEKLGISKLKKYSYIEEIFNACYYRSKDLLEGDVRYFASKPEIVAFIEKLKKENEPTAPLIRIGGGQGFLGITIDLILGKKGDLRLYDEAIREGVSLQRHWRTQKDNFPKTRRVVIDKYDTGKSPMGWVKIFGK